MSEAPSDWTFETKTIRLTIDRTDLSGWVTLEGAEQGWRFDPRRHLRASVGGVAGVACSLQSCTERKSDPAGVVAVVSVGPNTYQLQISVAPDAPDVIFAVEPLDEPEPLEWLVFPGPILPGSGL